MARSKSGQVSRLGDLALAERVQSILINAAEGRRNIGDDNQYATLRKQFTRRGLRPPSLVVTHPSVDSFTAFIKGIADRDERGRRIRSEFEPLLRSLETGGIEHDASATTGIQSRAARLKVVCETIPLAQAAIDALIAKLEEPNLNGGPPLDHHKDAIENLRNLHRSLGDLLNAIDGGHFDDELGQGLIAETVRYSKRAARALRDDPLPYVVSALLMGTLHALGFPAIGGFLGDIAQNIRKSAGEGTD